MQPYNRSRLSHQQAQLELDRNDNITYAKDQVVWLIRQVRPVIVTVNATPNNIVLRANPSSQTLSNTASFAPFVLGTGNRGTVTLQFVTVA
jgi:hypothetical protein